MIVIYTSINRSASGLILAIHEGSKFFFFRTVGDFSSCNSEGDFVVKLDSREWKFGATREHRQNG